MRRPAISMRSFIFLTSLGASLEGGRRPETTAFGMPRRLGQFIPRSQGWRSGRDAGAAGSNGNNVGLYEHAPAVDRGHAQFLRQYDLDLVGASLCGPLRGR